MELASLSVLNPSPQRMTGPGLLHELVQPSSTQTALEHLEKGVISSFTYAELHSASDLISQKVSKVRPAAGDRFIVPVLHAQSPGLYAALLGILKAGGAFCPLNLDVPADRLDFILKDVDATVVVVSAELQDRFTFPDHVQTVVVETLDTYSGPVPDERTVHVRPSDLAYVMYTSGSTGVPKGVAISHDAASQALMAHDSHIPEFSRFFQFAASTFDVSVFEIFFPLTRGKTLISASRTETLEDLTSVLRKLEVDACELTPTVAAGLLRSRESVPKLRTLLTIGEMLNKPVIEEFGGNSDRPSILWAMYGPTEATIHFGIIGFPLKTVSCFVLDPEKPVTEANELNVLPRGHIGELAVGGFQLADGYLNRPEQTTKAFITTKSGKVYRTGDKARLNEDGLLECFGRLSDGQVKLRGQRIELGEIEQAMLKTPQCHVATALVENSMLVGFCAADASVSQDDVLDSCRRWLPGYMVPGEIIILSDLPKLPSGKVDRQKLRLLLKERDEPEEAAVSSPRDEDTDGETLIQAIAECLDRHVSPTATLTSLGLDSLRAIRLAAMLRDRGLSVGVADILRARTVSDLKLCVQELQTLAPSPQVALKSFMSDLDRIVLENPSLRARKTEILDVMPCTSLQSAMLTAGFHEPEAYHNEMEFTVQENISLEVLRSGLEAICNQNEILRTGFVHWEDKPVAVVFRRVADSVIRLTSQESNLETSKRELTWLEPLQVTLTPGLPGRSHSMVIRVHHAVYDGWSMDAVLNDLWMYIQGHQLPQRPQFSKVVNHQYEEHRATREYQKRFWSDHLANWKRKPFPTLVEKPASEAARMIVTHDFKISRAVVQEASQRIGCGTPSLFVAALSLAWKGILGSDDFVIGTTTSGRALPIARIDDVIGPCMSALPVRVQYQQIETTDQLVKYVDDTLTSIIENSTLSLAEIRNLAGLRAFESLYDVLLTFQESLHSQAARSGPFSQVRHLDRIETKLLIEVEPTESGFSLQATYHEDVLDFGMATEILRQIQACLEQAIIPAGHSLPLAFDLELTAPSIDRHPAQESTEIPDLAAMFEEAAEQCANLDAIEFINALTIGNKSETLTYKDLNERANRTARWLQARGAQPCMVIGIMMEKSVLLYVCILAVIKAGCAYLPLLPTTPPLRVKEIMAQAAVNLCLVDRFDGDGTSEAIGTAWILPDLQDIQSFSESNLHITPDRNRLAYVIFTSGTTGVPKGVSVTQGNITSNIQHLRTLYPRESSKQPRLLQACSQAFDVSVFEIFYAWSAGMSLCSGTNDTLFADIEENIRALNITHLSLTPTVAAMIDPEKTPSVQFLVTAGEPLTRTVLNKWGSLLWQGYGPSETTNICTVKRMDTRYNIEHLGRTFPNTCAVVLQHHSQHVLPFGWVGELCFGGEQVAQGYMGDAHLTASKFFNHKRYGRLYRSGDLGRMLPDGSLVILGRIDTQVKLRGQRIEIAEIDQVLSEHQSLHSAVTLLVNRKRSPSVPCLASFITYNTSAKIEELEVLPFNRDLQSSIRAKLKARLPSYMIPTYIIPISRIPQTSSGKCDGGKLRMLFEHLPEEYLHFDAESQQGKDADSEWQPDEKIIRGAVAHSLGVAEAEIGRWSSLMGIGLDSISAIRVAKDLSAALNERISISTLLQYPCISLLAHHLREHRTGTPVHEPLLPVGVVNSAMKRFQGKPHKVSKVLPCTPLQEGMLSQGRDSYYNKVLLRLRSSPDLIQGIWNTLCSRHETLRTCFVTTNDRNNPVVQVVLEDWNIPWHSYSLKDLSMVTVIEEHMASLPEPVNSTVPPLSLALIKYRGSNFLSFICHHALYDGTAISILWREIETLAHGQSLPPPISYEPFLHEMKRMPKDWRSFWKQQLRNRGNRLVFPTLGGSSIAQQAIHTTRIEHRLDETRKILQSYQVGLLSLCQAAWATVLTMLTDSRDVMFGNVVSGRNVDVPGVDMLMAPCFNTIPIRCNWNESPQNRQALQNLQELNQKLLPYQFSPLREISRLARASRLFDTLLLVQQPLAEMDETIWTLEEDVGDMDVPLVCEVTPCPNLNSIAVKIYYDMSTLAADQVTAISKEFARAVSRLLTSPLAFVSMESCDGIEKRPAIIDTRSHNDEHADGSHDSSSDWLPLERLIRGYLEVLTETRPSSISKRASFFRLGIDSISAIQLSSMLKDQGYTVTPADVMENPSCEKLAQKLLQAPKSSTETTKQYDFDEFRQRASSQISRLIPEHLVIEDVLPCTPIQCAMARLASDDKDKYMNLIGFKLDSGTKPSHIIAAWDAVRHMHHMLRTAVIPVDSIKTPFAMVRYSHSSSELSWQYVESDDPSKLGVELKREFGNALLQSPHLPPWKVGIATVAGSEYMYLIIHHALYDALSLRTILRDLASALRGHQISPTSDPIEGLLEILAVKEGFHEKAEAFWRGLAPRVVVNRFPTLTPLRECGDQRQVALHVSRMSFSTVRERCRFQDVTVQALVESAWTRILAAYTGEDSVVFGITLSTRDSDATEKTPIPCLTTLPVVARNYASNSELLQSMVEHDVKLTGFRRSLLSDVQRWLGHPASALFDTLVTYQGHVQETDTQVPWTITDDIGLVEYPVALEVQPSSDDRLNLTLSFSPSVVPTEQAEYILRQFDAIMYGLLHHAENGSNDLFAADPNLFSVVPAAVQEILTETTCLHEFVESQAVKTPQAVALEFHASANSGPKTWTYTQLDETGSKVADILSTLNLEGSLIAVHFDKCPEAYFAILGALKAGFAFVALDPSMPRSRKEFIMQDSRACCLLTTASWVPDFEVPVAHQTIDIDHLSSFSLCGRDLRPTQISSASTCYCLYTSGTTGTPKGCEITHENAVQAMMAFRHLFRGRWNENSRWLQFAALHFDVSILEQYWTWSVGMTLVVTPREVILDDLAGTIARLQITHLDLTPSLARLLDPEDVPSLWNGVFITGGEQLRQEILDAWGPKGVIYNAYGPTEATIGVTTYSQVPQNGRPSNIGKQFLNVGTYVLHPGTDLPVLRGAVGELCIAGKLVGKGYINREDTTLERFPYLSNFSERVYRTGDLVRLLSDGSFDFLGRADDQVKLRGQRLELGEIDHVIRTAMPDIEDLATIVVTQKSLDRSVLVCFLSNGLGKQHPLQPMKGKDGLDRQAKAACRSKLPSYMVPTYFLEVPYIPLSINNKAEHKTLRKVFEDLSPDDLMNLASSDDIVMSRNGQIMLDKVTRAFSDFNPSLELRIQPSSSIFEAGVDSINVLLFVAALRRVGVNCSAAIVLQNPVVSDLAEALAEHGPDDTVSRVREARLAIRSAFHRYIPTVQSTLGWGIDKVEYIAPCTPLQEGMTTSTLSTRSRDAYFVSFDLRLSRDVNLMDLRNAWHTLVQQHAILRTVFLQTSEGCIQIACRDATLDWVECAAPSERAVRKLKWLESNKDSILKPMQFTILHDSDEKVLCLDIFHGIYDGASLQIMLQQVTDIYKGTTLSHTAPSFVDAISYGPLWDFGHCKDFWTNHLGDWKPSKLGLGARDLQQPTKLISADILLPRESIEGHLKRLHTTHQSLILAAWTSAQCQLLESMPTTGLVVGGRSLDLVGVEGTVGPLFNTVPFSAASCKGRRWTDIVKHCNTFSSAVLNFQHVSLREIQKWCSLGQHILDNLLTVQPEDLPSSDEPIWTVEESTATTDYPLALEAVIQKDGNVGLHLVADAQVVTKEVAEQLLVHMKQLLAMALEDGDTPWRQDQMENEKCSDAVLDPNVTNSDTLPEDFVWSERAMTLRRVIASVANCSSDSMGAYTSMVELGLDSIDVLRLAKKLRDNDVEIAPSTIMRCQTIAAMISATSDSAPPKNEPNHSQNMRDLEERLRSCLSSADRDLSNVETVLPTTPLQEGMIVAMLDSDFEQYYNHEVFQLHSEVDLHRLHTAWNSIIEANPILRTGFAEVTDEAIEMSFCQIVHTPEDLQISHHDIKDLSESEALFDLSKALARRSMGWDHLLQIRFASTGSERYMIVTMAHALYDGWSLRLIYQDLWRAYESSLVAHPSLDYYLSRYANRDDTGDRKFWESFLHAADPTLLSSKGEASSEIAEVYHDEVLSKISGSAITAFCREKGVSLQTLCYGCWSVALARRAGQLDVSFGAVLAGRDFEGAEELVFPTMNTVVQRCIISGTCASFLSYLEQNMQSIRPRQSFPLRKALSAATGGRPLFDSIFMVQRNLDTDQTSYESMFTPVMGFSETEYPLCGESEMSGEQLIWRVTSRSSLYREPEVALLLSELDSTLEYLMKTPDRNILDMQGDKVSICGFEGTVLRDVDIGIEADSETRDDHSAWSAKASEIAEVLSIISHVPANEIKPSNSIYHLGLDSITAIKVSSLLRQRGIMLRPRELLQASDISEMARLAEERAVDQGKETSVQTPQATAWVPPASIEVASVLAQYGLSESDVESIIPALPMQLYMMRSWYDSDGAIFFPEFRVKLPPSTRPAQVDRAWEVAREEMPLLRTFFCLTDLEEYPIIQVIAKHGHAITSGPWSTCWAEAGDDDNVLLVLKIHHALYDAFSLTEVLKRLVCLSSESSSAAMDYPLQPWLERASKQSLDAQATRREHFWKEYLGPGAGEVKQMPVGKVTDCKERTSHVDSDTGCSASLLRRAAAASGTSVQALFLAACAKSIASETHGDSYNGLITLGLYFANREADGLPACYPTLDIIPIKVQVQSGNPDLVHSAHQVQKDLNAISSQGVAEVSLLEIKRWTGITIDRVVNFIAKGSGDDDSEQDLQFLPPGDEAAEQVKGVASPEIFRDWNSALLKEAYPPTIEIEASLDDKVLTVGVFGPQILVSAQEASSTVRRISSALLAWLA
ncbi:hypothetical protein NLU13_6632 [Sarocladium strictum]|uniref:Carrier domain-containing protein n=1 Tax=Sarocladium strictum TaxID=5046 RepID=A0AA39GGL5_SARSR|nr:hypothetical protein NLU13_6632 [Sarocladium strictum]